MKKRVFAIALCACMFMCTFSMSVFAQDDAPTDSFTRWGEETVPMRPVYEAVGTIGATDLEI